MANSKKVASLIEKKRKISKEIEDLQNECNHLRKSIKSTNILLSIVNPDKSEDKYCMAPTCI